MNYFVEGIQGSGKSTLVQKLAEKYPGCTAVMEGDYSPVELAWCARMSEAQYSEVLERWKDLQDQIRTKSHKEGDHWISFFSASIRLSFRIFPAAYHIARKTTANTLPTAISETRMIKP